MTDDTAPHALAVETALYLGVLAFGVATGVFLALQVVLSQVRLSPTADEVIVRFDGSLYGGLEALQTLMQASTVAAALLLVGGAALANADQVRGWYQEVASDG